MATYSFLDRATGKPFVIHVQVPQTRVQVSVPPPKVVYPPENPLTSFWMPLLTLVFTAVAAATGGAAAVFAALTYRDAVSDRARTPDLRLSFDEFQTEKVVALGQHNLAAITERLHVQNLGDRDAKNVQVVLTVPSTFLTVREYQELAQHVGAGFDNRDAAHAAGQYYFGPVGAGATTRGDTLRLPAAVTPVAASDAGQLNMYAPVGVHHIRCRIYCTETGRDAFSDDLIVSVE